MQPPEEEAHDAVGVIERARPVGNARRKQAAAADYARQLPEAVANREALARIAARAYPEFMLADQAAWFEIQKNEEANLAAARALFESIRERGARSPSRPARTPC
jgi:hypothetical protein